MRLSLALSVALLSVGCGKAVYEARLANTVVMLEQIAEKNAKLAGEWKDNGISLRPPAQFKLIPPPEPVAEEEGSEGKQQLVDERQPDYVNIELPGLRAAFKAEGPPVNDGVVSHPSYLYVLSNQDIAPENSGDKADSDKALYFTTDTVKMLSTALNTEVKPTENPEEWKYEDKFPRSNKKFVEPVFSTALTIEPEQSIRDTKLAISLYLLKSGDVQVILIYVLPENVSMRDPIELSMETVKIEVDKLGGAPGADPSGSSSGGSGTPGAGGTPAGSAGF